MKKTKTVFIAALAIFTTITFTSCSSSPEAVAKTYFEASLEGDFEKMKSVATESQALNLADEMTDGITRNPEKQEVMDELKKADRTYQDAVIDPEDENKATVTVVMSDPEKEDAQDISLDINLLNEDGDWKVDEIDAK